MKLRILAYILILSMVLSPVSSPAFAEEDGYLFFCDFESEDLWWNGATFSRNAAYNGEFGIIADSPVGGPTDYGFANMLEYDGSVYLEEGLMYCLSFLARSDAPSLPGNANALYQNGSNLVFELFGLETGWKQSEVYFTVSESRQYGLDLLLYTETEAAHIELDDIALSLPMFPPDRFEFTGRQQLKIPDGGTETYRIPVSAYSEYGDKIPTPILTYEASELPDGVSLNSRNGALTISSDTRPGSSLTLIALLAGFPVAETTVVFSSNMIPNGDFEASLPEEGWISSAAFSFEEDDNGRWMLLDTPEGDDSYSYGILQPENTVALQGDTLYVFRARVHTTSLVPRTNIYIDNTAEDTDTSITVDINGISGEEWAYVSCPIRPEKSGVYALSIRFITQLHQPVYIDDITLSHEEPGANEVRFSIPGHITRPLDEARAFPMHLSILDQEGNEFPTAVSAWTEPNDGAVTVDFQNECLWVTPDAFGDYSVFLSSDEDSSLLSEARLTVSDDFLGDGDFETTEVGEWWAAGEPAEMAFVPASYGVSACHGDRMAEVTLNDTLAGILTNSYSYYSAEETYVFHGMLQKLYTDIPVEVTPVLSDAEGNYTFIASDVLESDSWWEVSGIFSPEEDLIGKLLVFLSIEADQPDQRILLDDLRIERLSVSAENTYLSGAFTPDSVAVVNYDFRANFKTEDASLVRWYIADSENGNYILIDNQPSLLVTPEMLGSYLKAEILPVSLIGGFVGESVWSEPRVVSSYSTGDDWQSGPPPTQPPIESPRLFPRSLPDQSPDSTPPFSDIAEHWAETEVTVMERMAVATGYEDKTFRPDLSITRAEFTALLARSFNLFPRAYSGRFEDVNASDWYAGIVETAYQYRLINGVDASHFDPNAPITREQIALMVMRAYDATEREITTSTFIQFYDEHEMMPEAVSAIRNASGLGIITGMNNHTFSPKENATRAQAVVMLYRLLNALHN